MEMLKVVLYAGSSQHGKIRRAPIG